MKYIDIHAHLSWPAYDTDREEVIKRAFENDVAIINVGTDILNSKAILNIVDTYSHIHPHIYSIPGIHPHWIEEQLIEILYSVCSSTFLDPLNNNDISNISNSNILLPNEVNIEFSTKSVLVHDVRKNMYDELSLESFSLAKRDLAREFSYAEQAILQKIDEMLIELHQISDHPSVVAIGECGIDVYKLHPILEPFKDRVCRLQEKLFVGQIEIAQNKEKVIMIHARDSYKEILSIIDKRFISKGIILKGNVHFFTGNSNEARAFLNRGFTVSFTGVITFAKVYETVLRDLALTEMMSETDCPFVAPVPYRGRRNEPSYVIEIVRKIAQIRGEDESVVQQQLILNAENRFSLNLRGPFA